MAKIIECAVSSFQLGWRDAMDRRVGRELASAADSDAYWRGVERASAFRRAISARAPELRGEATGDEQ